MSEGIFDNPRLKKLAEKPWFLGAAFIAIIFGGFIVFSAIYLFVRAVLCGDDPAFRDIGILILAIFGAPFVIWRSIVAQGNLDRSKDRDYADLFTKAVEQLGATREVREWDEDTQRDVYRHEPNIEVRLGAIYALERISQDSERDHIAVMEVLCAYVRENAPAGDLTPSIAPFKRAVPPIAVQAAITVLGRRSAQRVQFEWEREFGLDLRDSDLSGVTFRSGNFAAAIFFDCRLEAAEFREADLSGTKFNGSLLNFINMFGAKLTGTRFDHSTLTANRSGYVFSGAHGISVVGADLSGLSLLGNPSEVKLIFGSKDTKLTSDLDEERNRDSGIDSRLAYHERRGDERKIHEFKARNDASCFGHWFEHDSSDLALSHVRKRFLDKLGLVGWPYQ